MTGRGFCVIGNSPREPLLCRDVLCSCALAGRPADEERGGKRSRTHTQEMYYIAYDMDVKIIKPGPDGSVFLLPALFRF